MPEIKPSHTTAEKLKANDRFLLAGNMYRVEGVNKNTDSKDHVDDIELTNIGFFPTSNPDGRHSLLIVPSDTKFSIYLETQT